ncbi:MAG: hypothetical protein F6K10_04535 [Moorea sp. SIO2B7]|uniref:Uncharacterized protein n=1 Tax=Moorena producens (strain JHB) TaxID=1454205 RepID=A0A9Q9SUB6_MOOP1|nr:hypothetical protein [Moorena producens]NES80711.1 hypothetical protein [Moorena sp. SIO2B7]WAN69791.1 hypothetical protein BJP36_37495 [Moorena producens JHB]
MLIADELMNGRLRDEEKLPRLCDRIKPHTIQLRQYSRLPTPDSRLPSY